VPALFSDLVTASINLSTCYFNSVLKTKINSRAWYKIPE
jgi:hypothetical protein